MPTERRGRVFSFPLGRRDPIRRGVYVVRYEDGSAGDEEPAIPDTADFRARLAAALAEWAETRAGRRAAAARLGRLTIPHVGRLLCESDFRPSLLAKLKKHGIQFMEVLDYDERELVPDWFVDDDLLHGPG